MGTSLPLECNGWELVWFREKRPFQVRKRGRLGLSVAGSRLGMIQDWRPWRGIPSPVRGRTKPRFGGDLGGVEAGAGNISATQQQEYLTKQAFQELGGSFDAHRPPAIP